MPSKDSLLAIESVTSFKMAVKHLFRHLHRPRALRTNPLVNQFFDETFARDVDTIKSERRVLDRIHARVRQAAEHCRSEDIAEGKVARGCRQHTIVTSQCLGRRPIREVAATLGISYYHCYRERAAICLRIARYICNCANKPALGVLLKLDEFQILATLARRQAASGDANAAFHACDTLVSEAGPEQEKIEALRISALVSIDFGNVGRAEVARLTAAEIVAKDLSAQPLASRAIARACLDLIDARLAYCRADVDGARKMAQCATAWLEQAEYDAPARIRELNLESLFELGAACWNSGSLEAGFDWISKAEQNLHRLHTVSPQLRARISLTFWRLRSCLLTTSKAWCPSWQRLDGLAAEFDRAYEAGALFETGEALVALLQHHVLAGNDGEALKKGRLAIQVAQQSTCLKDRTEVAVFVAANLLPTRFWKEASLLFPRGEDLGACDAHHRELASYFFVEYALRSGRFEDAWVLAKRGSIASRYAIMKVKNGIMAALAAHELGRQREASTLIEATISSAEEFGSTPILKDAYRAAATVTANSRFARRAEEVEQLLRA